MYLHVWKKIVVEDDEETTKMHVTNPIKKANGALNAIKLIKKYFTNLELVGLVTSNYYSVLFYNSEIFKNLVILSSGKLTVWDSIKDN